jgi:hypothetical protein
MEARSLVGLEERIDCHHPRNSFNISTTVLHLEEMRHLTAATLPIMDHQVVTTPHRIPSLVSTTTHTIITHTRMIMRWVGLLTGQPIKGTSFYRTTPTSVQEVQVDQLMYILPFPSTMVAVQYRLLT